MNELEMLVSVINHSTYFFPLVFRFGVFLRCFEFSAKNTCGMNRKIAIKVIQFCIVFPGYQHIKTSPGT